MTWIINVPVATLWTSFDSPRKIDQDAISNNMNISEWLKSLSYEEKLGLCDQNLVQSQVLYGQEVMITHEKGEWAQVLVPDQPSSKEERGYPGWIPKQQLVKHADWMTGVNSVVVVKTNTAILSNIDNHPLLELSFQTILPFIEKQGKYVKVKTTSGEGWLNENDVQILPSINDIRKGSGMDIVKTGENFLHLPYLWGGMSGFGFDCSGFSYTMLKANGYRIPRDAHDQAVKGSEIDYKEAKPGDLLFFAYEEGKGRVHHVGIYYGDGSMIHAPKTGKDIEIIPIAGTIYEKELCTVRRYWEE